MPSFYRLQGTVQNPIGQAISGASVAVLTQPASFASQPGSPLASIFAANASNAATITGASWSGQQITFTFSTTPPADVIPGSFIAVSGVTPSAYNTTLQAPYLVVEVDGNNVIVTALTNPGTYVSGGTVGTSVLPNPTSTDGNGQWFIYAAAGLYSVQVYGPTIEEIDFPDQQNGTVAGGSVLSVGETGDGVIFNSVVGGSPVTTTGTLVPALLTQTAKTFLAGPASGSAATPTFRAIVAGDLPGGTGSVSSVALTLAVPGILTESVTGSPVTSSGTLALTIGLATQAANLVFAGPSSGGSGLPTFRALVTSDLPADILSSQALTLATQPTLRQIDSELELTSTVTSISGSVAAMRGAVTLDSGLTLTGSSFVYGVQGKLVIGGTLNNGSAFNAGLFGQLDTSGAGFAHTSGYMAPLILDYGATSHLASDPLGDMAVMLNTTTSLINSIIKTEAKANYLFDLNDLGQGNYIVAAAVAGSQNKCLAVLIDGVAYFIPLNTAHA